MHGKEGVSGSSPEEGLKYRQTQPVLLSAQNHRRPTLVEGVSYTGICRHFGSWCLIHEQHEGTLREHERPRSQRVTTSRNGCGWADGRRADNLAYAAGDPITRAN